MSSARSTAAEGSADLVRNEVAQGHTPSPWLPIEASYGDGSYYCHNPRMSLQFHGHDAREKANVALLQAAADLHGALKAVHALVSEAAATGFNCHDGDWAERLFLSQGQSFRALAKATGAQS